MPISAVDAISPAIEHTKRQLFQPFRFWQWARLALVGLLAGELSSGGGCNVPSVPHFPNSGGTHGMPPGFPEINFAMLAGLVAVLFVAALVLGLLLMYIGSVMRFILFDSVLAKECRIRDGWGRRQGPGWRYFLWKLLYTLVMFGVLIILVGIPAGLAFTMGLFNDPKQHLAPLILGGIAIFFAVVLFMVSMAVVYVLTKDFVVPQMALENIGAIEGWRRLWAMIRGEKAGYAGYVGMKIVLSIASAIILGMIGLILALIVLIPLAGIIVAAVLAGKSASMGFSVAAITLAVVAGAVLLALFLLLTSLISVPAIVFFPAYSIYFFAGRYPALSSLLYPAPAAPQISLGTPPPYEPPPLPPTPAPAG